MMFGVELGVAQRREIRAGLREYARRARLFRRIERPGTIALSVRIAGPGEIGPGGDELVREQLLACVQAMRNSLRAAVPIRKQILDVGGVIGERLKSRH